LDGIGVFELIRENRNLAALASLKQFGLFFVLRRDSKLGCCLFRILGGFVLPQGSMDI